MPWALTPDVGVFAVQAVSSRLRLSVAVATCDSPISVSCKQLLHVLASTVLKKFLEAEGMAGVALLEIYQAQDTPGAWQKERRAGRTAQWFSTFLPENGTPLPLAFQWLKQVERLRVTSAGQGCLILKQREL